jgi:uncharacterized protein YegJ (DUF2314 family)
MKPILLAVILFIVSACAPLTATPPAAPTEDLEFLSAVQQARDTLDEFTQRIQTPHPNRSFVALKVRFSSPDLSVQDIWVDNVTYNGTRFEGRMGDDIPALRLSFDEQISIPTENIIDWMIVEDDTLIGGYTIRLAYRRMTPAEREIFLRDAGYRID